MLKEYTPNDYMFNAADQPGISAFQPDGLEIAFPGDGAKLPVEIGVSQLALSELTVTQLDVTTEALDTPNKPPGSGNTKCDSCETHSAKNGVCA